MDFSDSWPFAPQNEIDVDKTAVDKTAVDKTAVDKTEVDKTEVDNRVGADSQSAPLLIFRLGETLFALPALAVREIHAIPLMSPLPETAPFIVGMFNLRGAIVPVLDLNARFGKFSPRPELNDKVIVLSFDGAPVAILAHEVRAVSRIWGAQVEAPPTHGRQIGLAAPFVVGVTQIDAEVVLLLHLPHLLNFSVVPSAPSQALSTDNSAPPLDSMAWTAAEREILQARALRLRSFASFDEQQKNSETDNFEGSYGNEGYENEIYGSEDFENGASPREKRSPVAIFMLGGEEFATPLELVREFASVSSVARVPCCPPHILGQINLRGDIVTLLDVRQTLRTTRTAPPFFAPSPDGTLAHPVSVVVVEHRGAGVGIAVDEVRDVLYLCPDEWSALGAAPNTVPNTPLGTVPITAPVTTLETTGNADYGREAKSSQAKLSDAASSEAGRGIFARGAIYRGRFLPLLNIARLLDEGGLEVDERA